MLAKATFEQGQPMALEFIEAAKWALPASKELYSNRNQIMSGWETFLTKILGPKSSVAFVGPGGIGKTVLLDHLTGAAFKSNYKIPGQSRRQESGKTKADGNRIAIVVAPGQGGPQVDSFSNIFDGKKGVDGIVFVAGNGLVSLRRNDAIQQNIQAGLDSVEKWRAKNQEAELKYLREVAANIRASNNKSGKPKWMLVAATKADLLFDDLPNIERYYSPHCDSEFSKVLDDLVVALGTDNFDWEAVPVCSALDDFSWGNEVMQSRLDEAARDHYLSQFVDKLGEMCR